MNANTGAGRTNRRTIPKHGSVELVKMIKKETDCYYGFVCPYNAKSHEECEHWCEVDDKSAPEDWEEYSGYSYPQNNPPIPEGIPAVWKE